MLVISSPVEFRLFELTNLCNSLKVKIQVECTWCTFSFSNSRHNTLTFKQALIKKEICYLPSLLVDPLLHHCLKCPAEKKQAQRDVIKI